MRKSTHFLSEASNPTGGILKVNILYAVYSGEYVVDQGDMKCQGAAGNMEVRKRYLLRILKFTLYHYFSVPALILLDADLVSDPLFLSSRSGKKIKFVF